MAILARRLAVAAGLLLLSPPSDATVEMQNQAKKLGFAVSNCLYCHASPHATEKMKAKARSLNISEGNCLACHGSNIPAGLNQRGEWLVAQKLARGAKACDMAWLKDYKEATPAPKPAPKPTPTPTPTPKGQVTVIRNP
jgi:hypothetical protein